MKFQLIQLSPLRRLNVFPDPSKGFPGMLSVPDDRNPPTLPDGFKYVPVEPEPDFDSQTHTSRRKLTDQADGWEVVEIASADIEKREMIENAIEEAETAFASLPRGIRPILEQHRDAVRSAIYEGDIDGAIEIVETTPDIFPGAADLRKQFSDILKKHKKTS